MFSESDKKKFNEIIGSAERPMILFDDDCDGLTSYAILSRRLKNSFRGLPVKQTPVPKDPFLRKIGEYNPDTLIILDKAEVDKEILNLNIPIVWVDHHPNKHLEVKENLLYLNPLIEGQAKPTAVCVQELTGNKETLWIAALGSVGDWYIPDFIEQVRDSYRGLVPEKWNGIEELFLESKLGLLVKVIMFNLKGSLSEVLSSVKVFLRIESPWEILNQTTSKGRFLWKKYSRLASQYNKLLSSAIENFENQKEPVLIFRYDYRHSFTAELSNELMIRFPDKIIIVARSQNGEIKASIRSNGPIINLAVSKALEGLKGNGGGHPMAAGTRVDTKDWDAFLKRFVELIAKQ